jgi:hypothetical protein
MAYTRIGTITATNRRHLAEKVANLPDGYDIKAGPRNRTLDQNAMLHAMFGELAKKTRYMGRQLTLNQWKTLMISGHAMATGLGADVIPGVEGEFVNIRESSASMSVARMTSLIEYIHAWAAENNVQFNQNY